MKLVHLSDLHLGKRIHEYSLIEDQEYILKKIAEIIADEKPDCVIIAGDVYDKTVPPASAVELFDDFLFRLSKIDTQVFIISGNHDSPERLSFCSRLIDRSGIHFSPVYANNTKPFTLNDEYGEINIYMLPFIKPANVRAFFPDKEISSYEDAVKAALDAMNIDVSKRNVLVTHQFVTGAQRSDSEEISVGGTDNISAEVFADFDYTALGHIHSPQNIGSEKLRYCGTPLKYSFSEVNHKKSVTVAELGKKGECTQRYIPLIPLHDMKEIRGSYDEVTSRKYYEGTSLRTDYLRIILTDDDYIPDVKSKLGVIYTNLMTVEYDNRRTRSMAELELEDIKTEIKSPLENFSDFYTKMNNTEMTDEQKKFIEELIEQVKEEML